MKPIWYFVGLILLLTGGIIFATGICYLIIPPDTKTVLWDIHPNIWWGLIMIIFGLIMFLKTRKSSVL